VFGVETGREVGRRGQIRIGFVEEQCFRFGMKVVLSDFVAVVVVVVDANRG